MDAFILEKATTLEMIIRVFRPEPLDEATLDKFYYDNTMPFRMGNPNTSPLKALFEDCTMPLGINAHLFTGHGGSGKSTEFAKLCQQFKLAGHPAHIINAQREMNLNLADCWDIMLFIAYGLCEIAEQNKIDIPSETLQAMFDYIIKDMEDIQTTDRAASVGIDASASASFGLGPLLNLFASIKSNLQFGSQTRTIIKEKMERRATEWLRYVYEIVDFITYKSNGKSPILFFEDLDKIHPYIRAYDIFCYDTLAKMPFPIIYSFPIPAIYDPRFASISSLYSTHVLPMINVRYENKNENRGGIEAIRNIVMLRADSRLFDDAALETMIKQTGGVLRHLFECIIAASRRARWRSADKIEMEDAQSALSNLRSMLSRRISMADYDILKNINNNQVYQQHIEDKYQLLELMHGLIVLEYQNGDRWQDLHPLIAELLTKQGVIDG